MYLIYTPRWKSLQIGFGNPAEKGPGEGIVAGPTGSRVATAGGENSPWSWVRVTRQASTEESETIALRVQTPEKWAHTIFKTFDTLAHWRESGRVWMESKPTFQRALSLLILSVLGATPFVTASYPRPVATRESHGPTVPSPETASQDLLRQLRKSALQNRVWRERNFGYSGRAIPVFGSKSHLLIPLGGSGAEENDLLQFVLTTHATRLLLLLTNSGLKTIEPTLSCKTEAIFAIPANAAAAIQESPSTVTGKDLTQEGRYRIEPWDGVGTLSCASASSDTQ
jgi:hypothetical protein